MSEVVIEKGIPIPDHGCGSRPEKNGLRQLAKDMGYGDSGVLPNNHANFIASCIRAGGDKAVSRSLRKPRTTTHPSWPGLHWPTRVWKIRKDTT